MNSLLKLNILRPKTCFSHSRCGFIMVSKSIVKTEGKCPTCFQHLRFCTRSRLKIVFSKARLKKRFSAETVCKSCETCHFFSCFIASRFWCENRFFLEKKLVWVSRMDEIGSRGSEKLLWQLSRGLFSVHMSQNHCFYRADGSMAAPGGCLGAPAQNGPWGLFKRRGTQNRHFK